MSHDPEMNALLLAAIEKVYGAAAGQNEWADVLDVVQSHFDCGRFALWSHDLNNGADIGAVDKGYDPEFVRSFTEYYAQRNIWAPALLHATVGQVVTPDELVPRDVAVKSEVYNDWLKPQENMISGVSVSLISNANYFAALTSNIPLRFEEKVLPSLRTFISALAPHLQQALTLAQKIQTKVTRQDFEIALSLCPHPAFIFDRLGHVLFMNGRAAHLLKEAEFLSIDREGYLSFAEKSAAQRFDRAFKEARIGNIANIATSISLSDGRDGLAYNLSLTPFADTGLQDVWLSSHGRDIPALLLLVTQDKSESFVVSRLLSERYNLSPREITLCLLLHDGLSLKEIAEQRSVSVNTLRNQLNSAFEKTNTNKQSALVRLIAEMCS